MTDYSSEIGELLGNQKSQLLSNAGNSVGINPDTEADLQNAASMLRIPLSSARQYKADVDRQMAQVKIDPDHLVTKTPALANFLSDPNNFNKSHDDIAPLQAIHGAVKNTETIQQWNPSAGERFTSLVRGVLGLDQKDIARASIARSEKSLGITDDQARDSVAGMSGQMDSLNQLGGGFIHSATAGIIPNVAGEPKSVAGYGAGAIGSLGGFILGAPMKATTYVGGKLGITALDRVVGESFAKGALKDIIKGSLALGSASAIDNFGNAINSDSLSQGLGKEVDSFKSGAVTGAIFGATSKILPDTLKFNTDVDKTKAEFVLRYLLNSAATNYVSGTNPLDVITNDKLTSEQKTAIFTSEAMNAFFSVHGSGRTTGGWFKDHVDAGKAEDGLLNTQKLAEATSLSKLSIRDPLAFKQYVKDAADGGDLTHYYVNGKVANDILHQSMTPEEIQLKMPEVASQLAVAEMADHDIKIPVEDFASHIVGTDAQDLLIPHMKVDENGMTFSEGQEFSKNQEAKWTEAVQKNADEITVQNERNKVWVDSAKSVEDGIGEELQSVGIYSKDVNDVNAKLARDMYVTMAHNLGVLPSEVRDGGWTDASGKVQGPLPLRVMLGLPEKGSLNQSGAEDHALLQRQADAIKNMDEEKRDNIPWFDHEGNATAYHLYEANKLVPKPVDKLKKVTERNSFALNADYDSVVNIDGVTFGVNKWEDPDNEHEDEDGNPTSHVYAYTRLDQRNAKTIEPWTYDTEELFKHMRKTIADGKDTILNQSANTTDDNNILHQMAKKSEAPLEEQIEDVKTAVENEGGKVIEAGEIDELVSSDKIKVLTVQDLLGLKIFPTMADRTAAGALYKGLGSSKINAAISLLGGPNFPLRMSNFMNKVIWAYRGEGIGGAKEKRMDEGATHMMVVLGADGMHQSNSTVSKAYFATLEAYIRDGRITDENEAHIESKLRQWKAKPDKTTGLVGEDAQKMQDDINNAPSLKDIDALHTYLDGLTFEARSKVIDIFASADIQDRGAPNMKQILDATRDKDYHSQDMGASVLLLKIDKDKPFITLGEEGTLTHPDYPFGMRGEVVGKFETPILHKLLWQDWWAKAGNEDSTEANKHRAFSLARPIVEVTQDLIDRIGDISAPNIDGKVQAKLAMDAVTDNWRESGKTKENGGIGVKDYIHAIEASDAKAVLSEYNDKEVTKEIKKGKMEVFQLGDSQVFFALKKGDPQYAEDYGQAFPDIGKDEVMLTSVVNNEKGASGVGGPAVILKALEQGATALDCFAVKTDAYPNGFLPELYKIFGFEPTGDPVPFNKEFYSEQKLKDAEHYWVESSKGRDGVAKYDPAKHGYPDLVVMKWRGTDEQRASLTRAYYSGGLEGLLRSGVKESTKGFFNEFGDTAGEKVNGESEPNSSGTTGDQRTGGRSPNTSKLREIANSISNLSDTGLENLSLTKDHRDAAKKMVADDILHQTSGENIAGFSKTTGTIHLTKDSNLTSFHHELGHFYLEALNRFAQIEGGNPQFKADMDKSLEFMGVKAKDGKSAHDVWNSMTLDEQRPYHEKFAEGYETYLQEGKAPTIELSGMFQRVKAWMTRAYVTMQQSLSPEIRSVYDHILATDKQIQETEAARSMLPMFTDHAIAEMTPEKFKEYTDMAKQASESSKAELSSRSIRDMKWLSEAKGKMLSKMQSRANAERNAVKDQVTKEVMDSDVRQAEAYLKRKGGKDTSPLEEQKAWEATRDANASKLAEEVKAEYLAKPEATDLKGIEKGQYLAKVKREMANEAERRSLQWEKENPRPVRMKEDRGVVHEMFGFDSDQAMVSAIKEAGSLRDEIKARTDQRMLEKHGDVYTPEAMEQAADLAVHNDIRLKVMATEWAALTKEVGPISLIIKAAKESASRFIGSKKIKDLQVGIYTSAEAKSGKKSMEAFLKGDKAGAAEAKKNQILNNQFAKATIDAKDLVDSILKNAKRYNKASTAKQIGADYMDRINELLSNYDLTKRDITNAKLEQRADLKDWLQSEYEANGVMPEIDEALLDFANRKPYKEMTVDELRALNDAVKSLEHVGKESTLVTVNGKRVLLENMVADALEGTKDLPHNDPVDLQPHLLHAKGLDKISAKWMSFKSKIRSIDSALVKMEQMFQWLSSGKRAGLGDYVKGPYLDMMKMASDAEGQERKMRAESVDVIKNLQIALGDAKVNLHDELHIPLLREGRGDHWYREELLALALNTGNESNRQKLAEGYKWDIKEVDRLLEEHLSTAEWKFVQGVWDGIGKYGDGIKELQRRQTGVTPKMIEPTPFTNKHGSFDGGYYPVSFDSFKDSHIEDKNVQNADMLFENQWARPTTSSGHTIARTGYVGPLHLSLGVIGKHIDQVTHDLAWREAIIDMNKFLSNNHIRKDIDQVMGREYTKQLRPWLQSLANDKVFNSSGDAGWESLYRTARTNSTIVGLGFRLSTMQIHGLSAMSNSIGEVGSVWFTKGMAQFRSPERWKETTKFIFDRSPEMANRMNEHDRNVHEAINQINHNAASFDGYSIAQKTVDGARRFSMYGVGALDMGSAMPTWMGAYLKGIAKEKEGGLDLSEDGAIEFANRAVRNAHGGGGTKDLSAVQRSKGAISMATMFYSFWNHMYNRQRDLAKGYGNLPESYRTGTGSRDTAKLLARSWFYFVVPQILHAMLKPNPHQGSTEDEGSLSSYLTTLAEEVGLGFVSGVPVLRDLANAAVNGRAYTISPLEQAGKTIVAGVKDTYAVATGNPTSKHPVKNIVNAVGYAAGLPTGQATSTATFIHDLMTGEQQPESLKDWWAGINTGDMSKH